MSIHTVYGIPMKNATKPVIFTPRRTRIRRGNHKKAPRGISARGFGQSFGNVYARGVILSGVDAIAAGGQGDDQFIDFLSGQRGQCL